MTIVRRGSSWGVKVWDRETKSYRWLGSFANVDDAINAEKDATFRAGRDVPTVAQWGRIWLSDYAREAASTRQTYRYTVEQITKTIGNRKLADIGRAEARRIANNWPRGTSRVARTMWADALRDEVVERNPWTNLRLETPRGRKDIDALTEPEIAELADLAEQLNAGYGSEAKAIILILAYTAMRPGELCALRREDVDLERGEVTIRYSRDPTGQEKLPKNKLPRKVVLRRRAIEALQAIAPLAHSPYLLHSKRGKRLTKGTLAYFWRPIKSAWVAQGGKAIDLYDLRHAAATMLIEQGLSVGDVAFQLGHQDGGRLVMELYGHPAEDSMRDRIRMADAATPQGMRRSA